MDGAGAEEQRLAPVSERGDVGGEVGDHGGKVVNFAHANEWEIEREVHVCAVGYCREDGLFGLVGGAHEADKNVGFGFVGDDVGSVAAVDETNVQGGGADLGLDGQ